MMAADALCTVPALERAGVRLQPLTEAVFDDYWMALQEAEGARLTGTHATLQPAGCAALAEHPPGPP